MWTRRQRLPQLFDKRRVHNECVDDFVRARVFRVPNAE